jgi:hypothetical protein
MSILDLTCASMSDLTTDYLERALPADEQTTFETHLVFCGDCRTYVDQLRGTIRQLGALGGGEIDEAERALLLEALRKPAG